MNNKKRFLAWLLLVTAATVVVAVASLLVLRLPDPWNWLIPLMFLGLINVVGFLADVVGLRSALLGGQSAPGSSIEVTKSRDVVKPALRSSTEGHPLTKPTVFISYSHADSKSIDQLVDKLQASGVAVWIDKWMIKVGDSITQRIDAGIGSSDFLIVVLSRASVKSKWVREELNAATIRNVEEEKHAFVLPILLEECEIPSLLQHRKYADFTDDPEQAFQELLEVIQPELEAPLPVKPARKNGDIRDYLSPQSKFELGEGKRPWLVVLILIAASCLYFTYWVVKWLLSASTTDFGLPVPWLAPFIGVTAVAASVTFFLIFRGLRWLAEEGIESIRTKVEKRYPWLLPQLSSILIVVVGVPIAVAFAAFLRALLGGGLLALAVGIPFWILLLAVLIPTNALNRLTSYSSELLERIRFPHMSKVSMSIIVSVAFSILFAILARLYFRGWTPLETLVINLLLMFGMIGIVRGFLKELGVTTVLLVLLFGLSRLEDRIPQFLTRASATVGFAVPKAPDPTGQLIWASFYILVIAFVTLISYPGETLAFEGKSPKGPKGVLFGVMTGLLNGYLVSGSIWYFLDKYDYPTMLLYRFQEPLTEFAQSLVPLLPLTLLRPFLPFLVVLVILARVIR